MLFFPSDQSYERDLEGKARVWGSAAGLFDGVLMRGGMMFYCVVALGLWVEARYNTENFKTEMAPCFVADSSFASFIKFQWSVWSVFVMVCVWLDFKFYLSAHTHTLFTLLHYMKPQALSKGEIRTFFCAEFAKIPGILKPVSFLKFLFCAFVLSSCSHFHFESTGNMGMQSIWG